MTQQKRPLSYHTPTLAWTASFLGERKRLAMQYYHVPLTPRRRAVHGGKKLLERDLNFYTCYCRAGSSANNLALLNFEYLSS